jgi:hypothetical protein
MSWRALRSGNAIGVILSEAKNLVRVPGGTRIPRSFAALRMTNSGAYAEKIDSNHEPVVHPRSMKILPHVTPAEAGVHTPPHLGSRVRGNDDQSVFDDTIY